MTNNSKKWNLNEILNDSEGHQKYKNIFENDSEGPASFNKRVEDVKKMIYGNNPVPGEVILTGEGDLVSPTQKIFIEQGRIIELYHNKKKDIWQQVFSYG